MNTKTLFSSKNSKWHSPPTFIAQLKEVYPIDLDLCASEPNVCERYYSEVDDGLKMPWNGWNMYFNHPYGRKTNREWATAVATWNSLKREPQQNLLGLIPNRAGARWYKQMVGCCDYYATWKGRMIFGSDEYWQYRWDNEYIEGDDGKMVKNGLFGKHGKKQAAPFDSTITFWGDIYPQLWDFLIDNCSFISKVVRDYD